MNLFNLITEIDKRSLHLVDFKQELQFIEDKVSFTLLLKELAVDLILLKYLNLNYTWVEQYQQHLELQDDPYYNKYLRTSLTKSQVINHLVNTLESFRDVSLTPESLILVTVYCIHPQQMEIYEYVKECCTKSK